MKFIIAAKEALSKNEIEKCLTLLHKNISSYNSELKSQIASLKVWNTIIQEDSVKATQLIACIQTFIPFAEELLLKDLEYAHSVELMLGLDFDPDNDKEPEALQEELAGLLGIDAKYILADDVEDGNVLNTLMKMKSLEQLGYPKQTMKVTIPKTLKAYVDAKVGLGLYLADMTFENIDLKNANLQNSNLKKAVLKKANLAGANLLGANLFGINLREANLQNVNFSGADLRASELYEANLTNANLSWANLRYAGLSDALLVGANLSSADLKGTDFDGANLDSADLSHTTLKGTGMNESNLSNVDLRTANIQGAYLSDSILDKTIFRTSQKSLVEKIKTDISTAIFMDE